MPSELDTAWMEHVRLVHVLAWRFAKVSNNAETATFLRQITSDVMSHAQIPAMQWFWGMHGLVLETSIWLLAESTRSQLWSVVCACAFPPSIFLMIVCCCCFELVFRFSRKMAILAKVFDAFTCWSFLLTSFFGWNSLKCGDNQVPISVQPGFRLRGDGKSPQRKITTTEECNIATHVNQQGAVSTAGKRKKHVLLERASALEKAWLVVLFFAAFGISHEGIAGEATEGFSTNAGSKRQLQQKTR